MCLCWTSQRCVFTRTVQSLAVMIRQLYIIMSGWARMCLCWTSQRCVFTRTVQSLAAMIRQLYIIMSGWARMCLCWTSQRSEVCVHQDSAESSCDDQTALYHHVRMSSYVSLLDVSEVRGAFTRTVQSLAAMIRQLYIIMSGWARMCLCWTSQRSEVCVHQDSAESSCDDQTALYHHVRMSSYVSLLDVSEVRGVRSPGQCRV